MTNRLFPDLPALEATEKHWDACENLGENRGSMHEHDYEANESTLELGHAIFGQALVHGLTGNSSSHLERSVQDNLFLNTPEVDLDWLYGSGPVAMPFMYTSIDTHRALLAINQTTLHNGERTEDFYRVGRTAIIGDGRNAENAWVAAFHLHWMKFHNWVLENKFYDLEPHKCFEAARKYVINVYHKLIMDYYIPNLCDPDVIADVMQNGPKYFTDGIIEVPLEFNHVMRYGHSQIPSNVAINDKLDTVPLLEHGNFTRPKYPVKLEWIFDLKRGQDFQKCRLIDTELSRKLLKLPNGMSLATANLQRSVMHQLPSFESIQEKMQVDGLETTGIVLDDKCKKAGFEEIPIWYGTLQESQEATGGLVLGPVASRIVVETLYTLCVRQSTDFLFMPKQTMKDWYDSFT